MKLNSKLILLVFAAPLLWTTVVAEAYDTGCGNETTPPDCGPCPCVVGDENDEAGAGSIKPYRANKRRYVTDLATFGEAPVDFTRIYNSRTVSFTTNYMEFGWKQTWQHNWNYEVRDLTSSTNGHYDVKVRYANGDEFNFRATDTNGLIRAPYVFNGDRLYKWTGGAAGHTLVTSGGWEYDFERTTAPRYELVRVRNGQGLTWHLSYNAAGKLERISNDFGRWLEIDRGTLYGSECITRVSSSDGRYVDYDYDLWAYSATNISTYEQIEGGGEGGEGGTIVLVTVTTVTYHADAVLVGVDYPGGEHAAYGYVGAYSNANGRPLLKTASDPAYTGPGARLKWVYNYEAIFDFGNGPYLVTGIAKEERNMVTDELAVSLPLGAGDYPQVLQGDGSEITRRYTNGLLVEKRDGEGRPLFYTRDQGGAGFIGSITDADSNTTVYVRDYAGRIIQEVDPLGHTNSAFYNDSGFVTCRVDRLGRSISYTRDTNNLLLRMDYPDGSSEEWARNEYGQVLTNRQRTGGTVVFTYYGTNETGGVYGDLKTRTDALGNTTAFTWDTAGRMTGITDANGGETGYAYDWRGNLLVRTNEDQTAVSYAYDPFGNRTNSVNELGESTAFTYDEYSRLETVRDALGRETYYEYGRVPGCGGCGAYGSTITRLTDAAGKVTEYTYDHSDRRLSETIAAGTAEASTNNWTYDAVGRVQTQTDANGNIHTWVYDPLGRVIAETNALGEVTLNAYDASGSLTNRTDGAGVITFWEYDSMNRITALGGGNLRYEYAYDIGGLRTAMHTRVNGVITETTTYTYDLNGHLITKTEPTGHVLSYGYDALGNRTNLNAASVLSVAYEYNDRSRLTAMTGNGKTTTYGYDDAGRRTNAVWPNGVTASYEYDVAGQLLGMVHRSGAHPLASFEYGYDLSGSRTNMVTLEGTNSYAYDARNWLTSASYPDGRTEEFGYDPVGNRVHLDGTGVNETDYTYGPANRLLLSESAPETNAYAYDAAGRLTNHAVNGNSRSFGYSFRSQMTSLTDTNGQVFTYAFDGDGNRISQSLNDCLHARYIYDGPNVVLELNASNEVIHAVVNGPGIDQPVERIAFVNGEQRLRQVYHTDGLGSVALMTDESQAPVKTYAYDAFGRIRSETGELVMNRWTYTGREALGDSEGLYYYRWRVMDPNTGRFTSEDPLGFVDGPNRYGYVGNDPVNYLDPSGLLLITGGGQISDACVGPAVCAIKSGVRFVEMKLQDKFFGPKKNRDKWYHCVTSCEVARRCGEKVAIGFGNLKERISKDPYDSADDQKANADGRRGADKCNRKKSCPAYCEGMGYSR
ncbi:MAG TPA: RHS repeat-associated core domain-containing protein [Kiritimatiellia bacterium]|nr:RHS repeat-associated core domain-containing protein [Kiritimatiellia bacterium]